MKNIFLSITYLFIPLRFVFILVFGILMSSFSFSQTNFFNGGTDITLNPDAIMYVDGNMKNFYSPSVTSAAIHNKGKIYLTYDWVNKNPSGYLDADAGSVILYGVDQYIDSVTTKFNNLDCQGTAGTKTLRVNTTVGGTKGLINSGVLSLNSRPFDLNGHTLEVTNASTTAITRSGGYIMSETDANPTPDYGRIKWDIGNSPIGNTYVFPFGTKPPMAFDSIYFTYKVAVAGAENGDGNVTVATYSTDPTLSPNNRPLPSNVTNLDGAGGVERDTNCVDRFWMVDILNYNTNPIGDITFTYTEDEWNPLNGSKNTIVNDSLRGWMWDGSQWLNPTVGFKNPLVNTVTVPGVSSSAPWTLCSNRPIPRECGDFSVPNAFSPNDDGHSDIFMLHGWEYCVASFSLVIFDRWGEKVFETENSYEGWDGKYKGKPLDPAVFVYYIKARSFGGDNISRKGNISLIH